MQLSPKVSEVSHLHSRCPLAAECDALDIAKVMKACIS